ncbi:RrF2 family transcriptional regulator [Desulfuribacillus stibiiarsenatis]|uniref:RrF2 family transcriptional regulator n=1 Tax=Desulfuribacillus stibiiarsenatis TaxID=1390249 RepID=UPI00159F2C90|nr:Rrf2 family transcriptional regulator [Desulfuribacillus stibiiarsenatis]
MQLTKQGDYAIRTVIELSKQIPNAVVPTKQIASAQNIPEVYLTKIVQMLVRSGILETIRGARGGVRLLRNPKELNFRHVIEAVEGPIALNRCIESSMRCDRTQTCDTHPAWKTINQKLIEELEKVTFDTLIKHK